MIPEAVQPAPIALCDAIQNGLAEGQVQVGFYGGDLGVAPSVCPRTSVGFTGGGSAIIETENLYGRILATGALKGSLALSDRAMVFATVEGVRYDSLIAPISSSAIGPGYTAVGASWQVHGGGPVVLAAVGKFVLPTAFTIDRHSWPLAVDLGVNAAWTPADRIVLHGSLLGMYSMALGGGPLYPSQGVSVDVGAEWRATAGLGLVLDGRAGFGYTGAVDGVSAGFGVRGAIGTHAGLALELVAPLAGRERNLAGADLRFDWRI
ncbi:MAG: hypothetical protein EXR69_07450 [Myxococcales bacterium]|nr:hypothetical protein [Myxococcales bacterium]